LLIPCAATAVVCAGAIVSSRPSISFLELIIPSLAASGSLTASAVFTHFVYGMFWVINGVW
jgi:hypothetical protein